MITGDQDLGQTGKWAPSCCHVLSLHQNLSQAIPTGWSVRKLGAIAEHVASWHFSDMPGWSANVRCSR